MTMRMTYAEWVAEGERRFGKNLTKWRFVCPVCGHVASAQDYKDAGAPESEVGFSCVGRWSGFNRDAFGLNPDSIASGKLPPAEGPGPCNYAGFGLINVNPVAVVTDDGQVAKTFAFADAEE